MKKFLNQEYPVIMEELLKGTNALVEICNFSFKKVSLKIFLFYLK